MMLTELSLTEYNACYPDFDRESNEDIVLVEQITNSRHPVYLTHLPELNINAVMKVFKQIDGQVNPCYLRESRIASLKHPNIISVLRCIEDKKTKSKGEDFKSSIILMEAALGDFCDLLEVNIFRDEKLLRTYFRQLVEVVGYLHSKGISHMDIKPTNILLGNDFRLKLADFELSYVAGEESIPGRGTAHYRAPELNNDEAVFPPAADVYAMGITLFVMFSGFLPFTSDVEIEGKNLEDLLYHCPEEFWDTINDLTGSENVFSSEFRELFLSMVAREQETRATLEVIKSSAWYRQPVYSRDELVRLMEDKLEMC